MDFMITIPSGVLYADHMEYTDPEAMARLLYRYTAHLGDVRVSPLRKDSQADREGRRTHLPTHSPE
jgi:hypothetical protein